VPLHDVQRLRVDRRIRLAKPAPEHPVPERARSRASDELLRDADAAGSLARAPARLQRRGHRLRSAHHPAQLESLRGPHVLAARGRRGGPHRIGRGGARSLRAARRGHAAQGRLGVPADDRRAGRALRVREASL
jgi:hypothetical protein